jgi:hypothetical protein
VQVLSERNAVAACRTSSTPGFAALSYCRTSTTHLPLGLGAPQGFPTRLAASSVGKYRAECRHTRRGADPISLTSIAGPSQRRRWRDRCSLPAPALGSRFHSPRSVCRDGSAQFQLRVNLGSTSYDVVIVWSFRTPMPRIGELGLVWYCATKRLHYGPAANNTAGGEEQCPRSL